MNIHEALQHPWLNDIPKKSEQIPSEKYYSVRDSVKQRYVRFFWTFFVEI